MTRQEPSTEGEAATSEDREDGAADRELSQSELDKVSGGVGALSAQMTPVRNLRG